MTVTGPESMRVTYDPAVDAAYIKLSGPGPLIDAIPDAGRMVTTDAAAPGGVGAMVMLDWLDGRLVGVEVIGASVALPDELLAEAERI